MSCRAAPPTPYIHNPSPTPIPPSTLTPADLINEKQANPLLQAASPLPPLFPMPRSICVDLHLAYPFQGRTSSERILAKLTRFTSLAKSLERGVLGRSVIQKPMEAFLEISRMMKNRPNAGNINTSKGLVKHIALHITNILKLTNINRTPLIYYGPARRSRRVWKSTRGAVPAGPAMRHKHRQLVWENMGGRLAGRSSGYDFQLIPCTGYASWGGGSTTKKKPSHQPTNPPSQDWWGGWWSVKSLATIPLFI